MAIADTIQSMYENVGEVYDTITNVDVNNGKNLFDYNKITTSAYYTNNYDGSFTRNSNGSSITINVDTASVPYDTFSLLAGTYSVSFDITTTSAVTINNWFLCTKQNGTGSNLAKSIGVQIPANTTTHIKAENYVVLNNAEKVGFAGYLSASTGVVISNIQVEKGTTATEYQPYTDNPTYKNIQNIPSTMRSSYLEIMNNGIDKIWNNWEKVTGEGETLTLNSTEEAPMKINLKGNTSQDGTPTPETPQAIHVVSGDNSINVCGKNLFDKDNANILNAYIDSGTNTIVSNNANRIFYIKCSPNITYTISKVKSATLQVAYTKKLPQIGTSTYGFISQSTTSGDYQYITITPSTDAQYLVVRFMQTVQDTKTQEELLASTQVELGSSMTTFVPYQSASYEIDLRTGKNLFDISKISENTYIDENGSTGSSQVTNLSDYIKVKPNTSYTLSYDYSTLLNSNQRNFVYYDENKTYISGQTYLPTNKTNTITTPNNAKYLRFSYDKNCNSIMLNEGSTTQPYEPYNSIELCKIGDYQDGIFKSTGKNLCNTTFELGGIDTTTGQNGSGTDRVRSKDYVEVKPNTTYTLSGVQGSRVVCFYNSSKAYLSYEVVGSQSTSGTFTTPNDTSYIRWYIIQTNTNINEMLNEGATALPYEPYGKVWYLKKETGKVVLNGSENWIRSGNTSENFFCGALAGVSLPFEVKMGTASDSKSNYFIKGNKSSNAEVFDMYNGTQYYTTIALYLSTSKATDVTTFKNWLTTHNTILYYVLNTPTYTEITDTTLLEQLEALNGAKSYTTQTNISQENNDLPFILDVTALKQLTQ